MLSLMLCCLEFLIICEQEATFLFPHWVLHVTQLVLIPPAPLSFLGVFSQSIFISARSAALLRHLREPEWHPASRSPVLPLSQGSTRPPSLG